MLKDKTNGGTILVIDDDDSMREGCRQTLEEKGYVTGAAGNGEEGLRLAEKMKPNVALVDLKMPGMNGMDVLMKIRDIAPGTASIVITGYGTTESAVEAMKLGAYDYLCKPFDDEVLLEAVGRGIKRNRFDGVRSLRKYDARRGQDSFAAIVCHQLRSPASAASQLVELVIRELSDPLTPRQASILDRAYQRIESLTGIIEDWLRLGRVEAGASELEPEPVDITQVIRDAWELIPDEDAGARVTLSVETTNVIEPIAGEKRLLCQLFTNLFSNSVKFTSGPGKVTVKIAEEGGKTLVRVSDTGVGIPAGELRRVFQPFYRGVRAGDKRKGGTGLGLAVAKKIVAVHGGHISVDSPPGGGAVFMVEFRAASAAMATPVARLAAPALVKPPSLPVFAAKVLNIRQFNDFVNRMIALQVVEGVKAKDAAGNHFVFGPLADASELRLDYDTTLLPPKKYLLPPREALVKFKLGESPEAEATVDDIPPTVLIGVHPYDMVALNQLDRLMSDGNPDPNYFTRRSGITIIGSDPTCIGRKAFWVHMGCDHAEKGFDLWLTNIGDAYVIEVGTDKGNLLLEENCDARDATKEELILRSKCRKIFLAKVRPRAAKFSPSELPALLRRSFDHPIWEENAHNCLSCGSCNMLCPTCYCFDVKDEVDISMMRGERCRIWDGCVLENFAKVGTGENFRETRLQRYRHRFYRKGMYLYDKYGHIACVGCGRCVSACLPDIADPVKVFNALKE